MRVRPLEKSDRDQWDTLWRGYLTFYKTVLPPETYDATFAALLSEKDMYGLVAERDGTLLGLAHVVLHSHSWRPEGVTYLQDLFTVPEARGTGVGRALIEAVYDFADAKGRPSVYWTTQEFNTEARKLYDRIGELTPFIKYTRPS